jgi:hypothetical protein
LIELLEEDKNELRNHVKKLSEFKKHIMHFLKTESKTRMWEIFAKMPYSAFSHPRFRSAHF